MIRHTFTRDIKVLGDPEDGRVLAVVSTEAKDRDGDIIRSEGWNLDNFNAHPVLLASHEYGRLRSQIGHWNSMEVRNKRLVGEAQYYVGQGNEDADWGFFLARSGRAAYSVGFIPDMNEARELPDDQDQAKAYWTPNYEFLLQELLEVSHVSIPANPEALQTMSIGKGLHPLVREVVDEQLEAFRAADNPAQAPDPVTAELVNAMLDERLARIAPTRLGRDYVAGLRDGFNDALKEVVR